MKKVTFLSVVFFTIFAFGATAQHYDHWSFMAKGGTSKVRGGDFNQSYGAQLEYGFSPYFGLGVEGMLFETNPKGNGPKNEFWGTQLYGSINLSNLLSSTHRKINFFLNGGAGLGWGGEWNYKDTEDCMTFLTSLGLAAEWNVSKHWGINLEGRYVMVTSKHIYGFENENNGLYPPYGLYGFYDFNLGIRYKFTAWSHEGYHVRNADVTKLRRF